MIELTDTAPVALRRPIRGLLWITGWLRALDPEPARRVALELPRSAATNGSSTSGGFATSTKAAPSCFTRSVGTSRRRRAKAAPESAHLVSIDSACGCGLKTMSRRTISGPGIAIRFRITPAKCPESPFGSE